MAKESRADLDLSAPNQSLLATSLFELYGGTTRKRKKSKSQILKKPKKRRLQDSHEIRLWTITDEHLRLFTTLSRHLDQYFYLWVYLPVHPATFSDHILQEYIKFGATPYLSSIPDFDIISFNLSVCLAIGSSTLNDKNHSDEYFSRARGQLAMLFDEPNYDVALGAYNLAYFQREIADDPERGDYYLEIAKTICRQLGLMHSEVYMRSLFRGPFKCNHILSKKLQLARRQLYYPVVRDFATSALQCKERFSVPLDGEYLQEINHISEIFAKCQMCLQKHAATKNESDMLLIEKDIWDFISTMNDLKDEIEQLFPFKTSTSYQQSILRKNKADHNTHGKKRVSSLQDFLSSSWSSFGSSASLPKDIIRWNAETRLIGLRAVCYHVLSTHTVPNLDDRELCSLVNSAKADLIIQEVTEKKKANPITALLCNLTAKHMSKQYYTLAVTSCKSFVKCFTTRLHFLPFQVQLLPVSKSCIAVLLQAGEFLLVKEFLSALASIETMYPGFGKLVARTRELLEFS
eukprot:TRINITY_DN3721_c0_g1_i2.p1 TRINITY_DN3721_c0_g1~~TRINITY_DN3721_c0_g1_i2.p1  ORF type:complete len:519 (-),score=49.49 TRINITY_DN3721_c0_g1_i2:1241-2797(-)